MQFEHFYNGKSLNEKEVYLEVAADYGIDGKELLSRMNDEQFHKAASEDFEFVKRAGIHGFPCVLGQTAKGFYMLANGYTPEEQMEKVLLAFRNTIDQGEQEIEINN